MKHQCVDDEAFLPDVVKGFWNPGVKTKDSIDPRWGIELDDGYYNFPVNFCPFCGQKLT